MATPDAGPPDPHGILAWVTAILEVAKQAYIALGLPAAGGIAWWLTRRDKRQDRAAELRLSEDDAHRKIADQLDRESAERFETMRAENVTLRAEVSRLLGLVRQWFDLAHDMRGEGARRGGPGNPMPPLSYDPDQP